MIMIIDIRRPLNSLPPVDAFEGLEEPVMQGL